MTYTRFEPKSSQQRLHAPPLEEQLLLVFSLHIN